MNLEIIKIASDTSNFKKLLNYTHSAKMKNPMCGDEIVFKLKINKKTIEKICYEGKFCVYCQASAETLSKIFTKKEKKNITSSLRSLIDLEKFEKTNNNKKLAKIFNSKNLKRKECIYLPVSTLMKALNIDI